MKRLLDLARRVVLYELRLYVGLARWLTRRPAVPREALATHPYARDITPVLWLWVFGSAVELVVVHLLLASWPGVQLAAAVLSAWGLVWMLGLLASIRAYPHLSLPAGLRVRYGPSVAVLVPWDAIATAVHRREDLPSSARTLQPRRTEDGVDLQIAVGGEVNAHLALSRPLHVRTRQGLLEVHEVSLFADEPKDLVAAVRERAGATAG